MPTLAEIRQQYPQYDDLSDQQLTDGLYRKFYADMPREEFNRKINYTPPSGLEEHERGQVAFESGVLGGLPIIGPAVRGAGERLAAGLRSITPGGKSYGEELTAVQRYARGAEKENPLKETFGEVTGGVAGGTIASALAPSLMGLTQPTIPRAIAAQGLSGASIGALDALARGQDPTTSAVVGGVGGALAPALAPVVRKIAEPVARLVRGGIDPELEAQRRVAGVIQRDAGQTGLSEQEFNAAAQAGTPVGLIDVAGEPGRALARSVANVSPEARGTLNRFIDDRFAGQAQRFSDWFQQSFHYPNAVAEREGVDELARSANRPAYQRAYEAGDRQIWSPELERMTAAPAVQSALSRAISKWRNFQVRDGYGAANPPFRVERGGQIVRAGSGIPAYPNIQLWDYAARELQDISRAAAPGTQRRMLYNDLARGLKNELDRLVPQYGEARGGAARFFGARNALEAGEQAVTSRMNNEQLRANMAKLQPTERQLFQDGFVSKYVDVLRDVKDRRSVLDKIGATPKARERLYMVLGRDRANELEAKVRIESVMDMMRGAVQGNSTTTRQLVELGLIGGIGGAEYYYTGDPKAAMHSALLFGVKQAARGGAQKIDERVVKRVAELLTSNDRQAIDRGMKLVARKPALLNGLRRVDEVLGSVAARAVGGVAGRLLTPTQGTPAQDNVPAGTP